MQTKQFHFSKLNLPAARLDIENRNGALKVYDILRGNWFVLTDEEWVRQHFTRWMMESLGYPRSIMANEIGLRLNGTQRRADTVVFGRHGEPLMIVEYKSPRVEITQDVFDQIVRYNMTLRARYLVVSNGLRHFCCEIDYAGDTYRFLPDVPSYTDAIGE